MQRRPTPELLDTDSGTPAEIAGSISDLRLINRWFGGVATTRKRKSGSLHHGDTEASEINAVS